LEGLPPLTVLQSLGDVMVAGSTLRTFDAAHGRTPGGAGLAGVSSQRTSKRRRLSDNSAAPADPAFSRTPAETTEGYVHRTGDLLLRGELSDRTMLAWAEDRHNVAATDDFLRALTSFFRVSTELHAHDSSRARGAARPKEAVPPWQIGERNFAQAIIAAQQASANDEAAVGGGLTETAILDLFAAELASARAQFTTERGARARVLRIFGTICSLCVF
jgi:hypothetical protein